MAESHATPTPLKVLHAGALTNLVGRGLGPAFERATGIPVVAERGHSVALGDAIAGFASMPRKRWRAAREPIR